MKKQFLFTPTKTASLVLFGILGLHSLPYAQPTQQLLGDVPQENSLLQDGQLVEPSDEFVEFSSSFLRADGSGNTIDVNRFSYSDAVPAGEYQSDIYVNEQFKGQAKLRYVDQDKRAVLCLTPELKEVLDLKPEAYNTLADNTAGCISFQEGVKGHSRFNLGDFRFDLTIAQALVVQRPRGWISPNQWQEGVPAAFVNYDVNHYRYNTNGGSSTDQTYLGIESGVNLLGWALRHSGSKSFYRNSSGTKEHSPYSINDIYARRGFATIQGELTVGDFNAGGQLLEGMPIRGASIASDTRMLPYSQQGYAPVIQGIANSNAKVTVRQAKQIIYQTTVPAGPFIIDDLYPSGYVGDLEVEITEANGQSRTFTVPYASVAHLIRQGHWRYQLNVGRYRDGRDVSQQNLAQASLQYGLTNSVTLNSAVQFSRNYRSLLSGAAINTPIGAFSADVTYAIADLPQFNERKKGYTAHANYSVSVPSTDTSLTLAAYRYSSREYYSLRDALWSNEQSLYNENRDTLRNRLKNQLQLVVNQRLGEKLGTLYISGSTNTYWNSKEQRHHYQLSYANHYKLLSYQLGYSHTYFTEDKRTDKRVYLSLSAPLGTGNYAPSYSTNFNIGKNQYSSHSISGSLGAARQWNYGLSTQLAKKGSQSLSANLGYQHPYASLRSTFGMDNHGNKQSSLSASGALVAHSKGITLSQHVSDNFAIIHAKGAEGAKVFGTYNAKIDRFGNAIVPYLTPYEINTVGVDPSDIPVNVELSATHQDLVPKSGSSLIVNLQAKRNSMILFDLKLADGTVPPMAAEAFDQDNKLVGYVVQGGRLFAGNLNKNSGTLKVVWDNGEKGNCMFDYQVDDLNNSDVKQMKLYSVECK